MGPGCVNTECSGPLVPTAIDLWVLAESVRPFQQTFSVGLGGWNDLGSQIKGTLRRRIASIIAAMPMIFITRLML
jgi:hypothetical protein